MAGNNSDYLEAKIAAWLNGTAMGSPPAALYVGLFSSDPGEAGAGTEVTTSVRTAGRVAATFTHAAGVLTNNAVVDFGNAANTVTVTHFAIYDAQTGGNELMYGPISAGSQVIGQNTPTSFLAGAMVLSQT